MTQYSFTDTPGRWDHLAVDVSLHERRRGRRRRQGRRRSRRTSSSRRFCATSRSPSNCRRARTGRGHPRRPRRRLAPRLHRRMERSAGARGVNIGWALNERARASRLAAATVSDGGTLAVRERDVLDRTESGAWWNELDAVRIDIPMVVQPVPGRAGSPRRRVRDRGATRAVLPVPKPGKALRRPEMTADRAVPTVPDSTP